MYSDFFYFCIFCKTQLVSSVVSLSRPSGSPLGCLAGVSALVEACSAGDGSQRGKPNPSVYLSMLIRLAHTVGSGNWKTFLEMLLNALNPKDEKLI